jgi:pimeloyl-ACP methyl ester carboxylesterase
MPRPILSTTLAVTLITGTFAVVGVPPAGALRFVSCASSPGFTCASVPVPLDRAGGIPGTISLSVERSAAGAGQSQDAVVALAGGPGQATLPLGEFIAQALAPALQRRDLLVFDQRGTGASDPLSCPALNSFASGTVSQLFEQCALQIGPARGAYTTQESVEDIETLRQASGYEKLILYGTSYGTKVSLEYAERYPQHVEGLVLDSVVPTDGPEPFAIPSFEAISAVLGELCSKHACAGITSNPTADLARLTAQLRKHALGGSAYDGSGRRHSATLGEVGLLGILEAGDVNPALRALLPAAVQSALRHDPDPLLRLHILSEGLIPSVPNIRPTESSAEIDEALFVATTCEETPFPWQRMGSPNTRLAEALAFLHAQQRAKFYPFDPNTALYNSLVPDCAGWPDASAAPPSPSALPDVPTLILSGAQDMRTPTSNARGVAALIPDAQLEVVPFTGHSVLGSDLSGCARQAVAMFFAGASVTPCTAGNNVFAPTPITPVTLATVHPPAGLGGKPGRTLTAVLDTIVDLNRQVAAATLQANQELPSGSRFGGLHGGYAKLTSSAAILKSLSFVAGVELSGTFPVKNGTLQSATIRISGANASPGTVRLGSGTRVTGTLGGKRFDVNLAKIRLSRAGGVEGWPARPLAFPLPGLVEANPAHVR